MPWSVSGPRGALSTNTYYFDAGVGIINQTTAQPIVDALIDLYTNDLESIWASTLAGTVEVVCFDLDDPKPRFIKAFGDGTFTPGGDSNPTEVSLKVGYRADRQLGVPNQRARGRVQLGPLAQATVGSSGLFTSGTVDAVDSAFDTFASVVNGALTWTWVTGSEDFGFRPIVATAVTNEPGTVRRRQNVWGYRQDSAV